MPKLHEHRLLNDILKFPRIRKRADASVPVVVLSGGSSEEASDQEAQTETGQAPFNQRICRRIQLSREPVPVLSGVLTGQRHVRWSFFL
jgi:hypothetical protein